MQKMYIHAVAAVEAFFAIPPKNYTHTPLLLCAAIMILFLNIALLYSSLIDCQATSIRAHSEEKSSHLPL
jgi:hypothetical protein